MTRAATAQDVGKGARPPIKYTGGKTSSLKLLLSHLPAKIVTYYEPMVGGGALLFALANAKQFKQAAISDINRELLVMYMAIKNDPDGLARELGKRDYRNDKATFLRMRARKASAVRYPVATAARFIYLNKTCFNGLHRVNKSGQFNVPFGHYDNPAICDEPNIQACSRALQNVTIQHGSVLDWLHDDDVRRGPKRGDVVYLDPPYCPVSKTANFTAFSKQGFTMQHQADLLAIVSKLAKRGVTVLYSNADVPATRKLLRDHGMWREGRFKVYATKVARSVNRDGTKRGKVGELLLVANERS